MPDSQTLPPATATAILGEWWGRPANFGRQGAILNEDRAGVFLGGLALRHWELVTPLPPR
jgi:hypothetical protein